MKNRLSLSILSCIVFLAACTKKETILQQYNPPGATLYGTWLMVNTSVTDSTKRYLLFANDGSNYFYQMNEDKYGFRSMGTGGVFSATDKQVIITSGGVFNYTAAHDSLILNQSPSTKIVALRVVAPTFTQNNFLTQLAVSKAVQTIPGITNLTYGFGFNGDSMMFYSNPYGTIRGYKFDLASRTIADSWTFGVPATMFYNAGYIYHGYSSNFRLAKKENKVSGAFLFASSNKLTDVRNLSMNTSSSFIYAFQADLKMFTGIDGGAFAQVFDFSPYGTSNVVYHNSDAFLMYRSGYIYKVKIAPKFQVLESYMLPVNYSPNMIASNGTDVWVYANNTTTGFYEFLKVSIP